MIRKYVPDPRLTGDCIRCPHDLRAHGIMGENVRCFATDRCTCRIALSQLETRHVLS